VQQGKLQEKEARKPNRQEGGSSAGRKSSQAQVNSKKRYILIPTGWELCRGKMAKGGASYFRKKKPEGGKKERGGKPAGT